METFTVRDLRERTGELIRGAEEGHLAVVTKHGQPVFVAVPFDEQLIQLGITVDLAIKLFQERALSTGQAAKLAGMGRVAFMDLLSARRIPVLDYSADELEQELQSAKALFNRV